MKCSSPWQAKATRARVAPGEVTVTFRTPPVVAVMAPVPPPLGPTRSKRRVSPSSLTFLKAVTCVHGPGWSVILKLP